LMPYRVPPSLPNLFMQPRPLYLIVLHSLSTGPAPNAGPHGRMCHAAVPELPGEPLEILSEVVRSFISYIVLSQGIIFAGICAHSPMRRS
jgi:hypothetical protein